MCDFKEVKKPDVKSSWDWLHDVLISLRSAFISERRIFIGLQLFFLSKMRVAFFDII